MTLVKVATIALISIASFYTGFRYGKYTIGLARKTISTRSIKEAESDESSAEEEELGKVKAGIFEQCKLVLCVRADLKMTTGKIAAQCGHATLACYKALSKVNPALLRHWEITGQAKIALKCSSEEELLLLQAKAASLNLCAKTIQDAGRTEVEPGTTTVLGIGPGPVELINKVSGHLRLL